MFGEDFWDFYSSAYKDAYNELDNFMEQMRENAFNNINGINFSYREEQNSFALSVAEAFKEKRILLIQAGVGTGKSFGYLIPIFYTINSVETFDKVIISTSSIALQEQLKADINTVSSLLGFKIKAWIAKGMNNYACLNRIEKLERNLELHNRLEVLEKIQKFKRLVYRSADKSDLPNIDDSLWENVQVTQCHSNCLYCNRCNFVNTRRHLANAPIVITNHAYLSSLLAKKDEIVDNASAIIVDEAHKLEENIRLVDERTLDFNKTITLIKQLEYYLSLEHEFNASYEYDVLLSNRESIIKNILNLAKSIRTSVRRNNRSKDGYGIEDYSKLTFKLEDKSVAAALSAIYDSLGNVLSVLKRNYQLKEIDREISELDGIYKCICDMKKGADSEYIFWARFSDINSGKVLICFCHKNLSPYFDRLYSDRSRPVIFTSGTLDCAPDYDEFKKSMYLTSRSSQVTTEFSISSPFNFKENSIFYYPKSDGEIPKDRIDYITYLAEQIRDLISVTEGKAMILFTAKSDMRDVYNVITEKYNLSFDLILQEDNDVNKWKEKFESNVNSCLFATGAFWEGIDIKGETLSNLIIAKLPFPVQDPVINYKKKDLSRKQCHELDTTMMLNRLAQGTGRLIRSFQDRGIVALLDRRTDKYINSIKNTLPFKVYTQEIDEVLAFYNQICAEKLNVLETPGKVLVPASDTSE